MYVICTLNDENRCRFESKRCEAIFGYETYISSILGFSDFVQSQNVDVLIAVDFDVISSGENLVSVIFDIQYISGLRGHFEISADLFQPLDVRSVM